MNNWSKMEAIKISPESILFTECKQQRLKGIETKLKIPSIP